MSNLVRLNEVKQAGMLESLQCALDRARAGQMTGFVLVEVGKEAHDQEAPTIKCLFQMQGVTDGLQTLAIVGALDFMKGRILKNMGLPADD